MHFGLFFDFDIRKGATQAETFERCFSQVEASERMGVDSIWLAAPAACGSDWRCRCCP